jgi:hypothetical protein
MAEMPLTIATTDAAPRKSNPRSLVLSVMSPNPHVGDYTRMLT